MRGELSYDIGTIIYGIGDAFALTYLIVYGFTAPWWKSRIGRSFMISTAAVFLSTTAVLTQIIFGPEWELRELIRTLGYTGFAIGMATFTVTFLIERRNPLPEVTVPLRKHYPDKENRNV